MSGLEFETIALMGSNCMIDEIDMLQVEKKFNDTVGFASKVDCLPKFFLEGSLPPSGNVFDDPEVEIDSVY